MLPVKLHRPDAGSYNCALARTPESSTPPAISTSPFGSKQAMWSKMLPLIGPVGIHVRLVAQASVALAIVSAAAAAKMKLGMGTRHLSPFRIVVFSSF